MKPRILMITRNLPPLVGGMERLNWNMAEGLSRHADVRIVAPAGAGAMAPADTAVCEVPLKPLWRFLWSANLAALSEARSFRPHVILAGSGLTAPLAWQAARVSGAASMAYVHGLDLVVKHPVYRGLWLPAIRRMDRLLANSRATAALAVQAGADPARMSVVHPGVKLPEIFRSDADVQAFLAGQGLLGRTLLLSVGRLSERKGLKEFVQHALPRIVKARPDVMLLVAGDVPANALSSRAQLPEHVLAEAERAGVAAHVRFMGGVSDETLEILFRSVDAHVFPIRDIAGDPEGFGMVAIEAAAFGVPTAAFACGGVVDAVSEGRSGRLVAPADYPALAEAVLDVLARRASFRQPCTEFAAQFEWTQFHQRMLSEVTSMLEGMGHVHAAH
ncbi:glycosyltransferase family 4 protein [Dyella acidiphila]|uniref:glycosyltransferase family 4 protein n=1 Tax=Dyella acidiphila TaxID=2775866 RepID=UPI0030828323